MYNHFDGQGRAPPGVNTDDKSGKCPLYDESHKRKDQQVDKAEKEAMAKVRAEHPDLSEEDLKIRFAKGLQSSSNRPHVHVDLQPHVNNHHRHYGHGIRGAAARAALYNREPDAALDVMLEGAVNILDGFGGVAPHALQQAREQGRQAMEQARATHQQVIQQQLQHHREGIWQQQRAIVLQQQARGEDLRRRLEQARQTHGARMTAVNDAVFQPIRNGPQAVDALRQRHNDQAFGDNGAAPNINIQDDARAGRPPNGAHRVLEDRSHGLGAARVSDPRREIEEFRRRSAFMDAERMAGWRPYAPNAHDPNLPPQIPGAFPQAPRGRNYVPPEALNPWVAGANDQAYL